MAMENNIKSLNIEDFKGFEDFIDYVDDDLFISNRIDLMPYADAAVRLNFFLIVMCVEGRIQFEINGKPYQIESGDTLSCLPSMIVSDGMHSAGAQIRMIGFSTSFLRRTLKHGTDMRRIFNYLFQNPIRHTHNQAEATYMHHYGALISSKIKDNTQRYRNQILEYIFSALIYEMLSDFHTLIGEEEVDDQSEAYKASSRRVFGQFIEAVSADGGRHRSVAYFAEKLCYSTKYVSSVMKQSSGRTALDWINEYAMQHIKYELKHGNRSMKEIAEMFDFPNQSFFGKYVKAHLGISPAKYRNSEN